MRHVDSLGGLNDRPRAASIHSNPHRTAGMESLMQQYGEHRALRSKRSRGEHRPVDWNILVQQLIDVRQAQPEAVSTKLI
jgi:hypothetical protein